MNISTPDKISMMAVSNGDLLRENNQNTINERAKYTANTGVVLISTANANLNGTGTLGTVLTAADNGTLIKTITINAIGNTTQGMVRLFIYDGVSVTNLIDEFEIPPSTALGTYPAYSISYDVNYNLKRDYVLKASTQNAENFVVIAEGLNWTY
jgi:hypothetical protein